MELASTTNIFRASAQATNARSLFSVCHGALVEPLLVKLTCNAVGLCLAEQIIEPGQLVTQEWDWKVDAVAVGDGSLLTSEDTQ